MSIDNIEIKISNELSGEDLEALISVDEAEQESDYPFISLS